MIAALHLVRHGEVANPHGIVYADLPGYDLSATGVSQASSTAAHLAATARLSAVWSSPLDRAHQTASRLADSSDVPIQIDPQLTEWGLGSRWAGVAWTDLPDRFPGELEAYLAHPESLPFSPESLAEVAARMAGVVSDVATAHPDKEVALVSHQDPIQALRLHLTGRPLTDLPIEKPGHACVITVVPAEPFWEETAVWCPPEASAPFPPPKNEP